MADLTYRSVYDSNIDPQYLHLLPLYIRATEHLRATAKLHKKGALSDPWPVYLNWLCAGDREVMTRLAPSPTPSSGSFDQVAWARSLYETLPFAKSHSEAFFINTVLTLSALRRIGLDVHGGLERMLEIKGNCVYKKHAFPMTSIIVVDQAEASRWVVLGGTIEKLPLEEPLDTHEMAVLRCTLLESVTSPIKDCLKERKNLKKEVDGANPERRQDVKWELDRVDFKLELLRKAKAACTRFEAAKRKLEEDDEDEEPEEGEIVEARPAKRTRSTLELPIRDKMPSD